MKNEVAGVAGAARINQMTKADLTRAEQHGKRLDVTGKSRAISDAVPVTTTGLELNALFEKHVEGAFVPRAHSKAMHVLIQFPKDLVDGEDAEGMLNHARAFTRRVFGNDAIFADRVDRDEKSRHVVDLFVAPKYIKKTKHQQKVAVSMTHHLKALAKEYGQPTGPHGCARALQDALFEYLRDEMALAGVMRGSPKQVPGPDWKSAEHQRVEELAELSAQTKAEREQVGRDQATAQSDREAAAAERLRAETEAQALADSRRALDFDREALGRREADVARRERQTKDAHDAVRAAHLEIDRQKAELAVASTVAARATEIAREEAIAATKTRVAAEADRAAAAQMVLQGRDQLVVIADERSRREAELALLMRAADDDEGLDLRAVGSSITMNERAMSTAERATFRRPWPNTIRALATKLAEALERVRNLTRRLREREERVATREAAVLVIERSKVREWEERGAAQRAEHEDALATLAIREAAVRAREAEAERRLVAADARIAAAIKAQDAANNAASDHSNWARAVELIGRYPSLLIHDDEGGFRLDRRPGRTGRLPEWLVATLEQPAPPWAKAAITGLHRLDVMTENVEVREREAASCVERLQGLIATAGPVLHPVQQAVIEQANSAIRQVLPVRQRRDEGQAM